MTRSCEKEHLLVKILNLQKKTIKVVSLSESGCHGY